MLFKLINLILLSTGALTAPQILIEIEPLDSEPLPSTTNTVPSTESLNNINICTELTPNFLTTRDGGYRTLECRAQVCSSADKNGDGIGDFSSSTVRFDGPLFDWNSQLFNIMSANGTCDYEKRYCWHSIDIDLEYFANQMIENGLNEMQLSCSVADVFIDNLGEEIRLASGTDFSFLKLSKGKALDESCTDDLQCGANMFCLNTINSSGTVCQCSVDFMTGVQYVEVKDQNYGERVCVKPVMVNESCDYDQQCQAMDSNSICVETNTDILGEPLGKCQCMDGMVYIGNSCQTDSSEVSTSSQTSVVWWIFSSDYSGDSYDEHSANRFYWLRVGSYTMAVLAVFLPLLLIIIAMIVLCYRRVANPNPSLPTTGKPRFPAPRLIPNQFRDKAKSDDKYGLVSNDELSKQ